MPQLVSKKTVLAILEAVKEELKVHRELNDARACEEALKLVMYLGFAIVRRGYEYPAHQDKLMVDLLDLQERLSAQAYDKSVIHLTQNLWNTVNTNVDLPSAFKRL